MKFRVLVADDDSVLRELLCDILKSKGYEILEAGDGQEAMDIFLDTPDIDLVILDVMMPKYDGFEVLKELREHSLVPVVMLTALDSEKNEILGLRKGADEYISKPFSYERLIARLESLLRRAKREQYENISIGRIQFNAATHKVLVDGAEVGLNHKEYQLLLYFIENPGIVLSRDKILNHVWGFDFDGDIRTIDTHVKMLRGKLMDCGEYIQTVRGSGYRFEVSA